MNVWQSIKDTVKRLRPGQEWEGPRYLVRVIPKHQTITPAVKYAGKYNPRKAYADGRQKAPHNRRDRQKRRH